MTPEEQAANLQFVRSVLIDRTLPLIEYEAGNKVAPFAQERYATVYELFAIIKLATEMEYTPALPTFDLVMECVGFMNAIPPVEKVPSWTRFPGYLAPFLQNPSRKDLFLNPVFSKLNVNEVQQSLFSSFLLYHSEFLGDIFAARFVAAINYFEDHQWVQFTKTECDPDKMLQTLAGEDRNNDYNVFIGFLSTMTHFDLRRELFNNVFERSELRQLKRSIRDCTGPRVGLMSEDARKRLQQVSDSVLKSMRRELSDLDYGQLTTTITSGLIDWTQDQDIVLQPPHRALGARGTSASM